MIVLTCAQRSPDWYAARLGRLCGSCAADMLATRKDKQESASRRNLRVRLALERLTGRSLESEYLSAAMQQGIEREADACGLYEALTGHVLSTCGYCSHEDLMAGCSPDGYVDDFVGIVEAKCPLPATHLDYLKTGVIPDEYQKQITHNLWITGAQWCDWLSYCPEFPDALRVKLVRVRRDPAAIKAYELLVRMFLAEVDQEYAAVAAMADAVA